ncbi:LysR family transcriptional regulator [Pseudomonas syringae pv. theae ICMP 3923]|uniref:LysR substrate-binding domain-containing protein n=1 Tax=Pseudomonas syringae TaxID=317 RepID=UPI00035761C2|nr:LysR substrate-binding domain-containing protein [Pseudomonas syringae]EPM65517.1 LysR family transcriptional regulator [Pseudomonas syringae pv. theae ICMP 3923]KPZ35044.1 hypothetical protein AN901_203362 [Pseudomonas syringae pv. theae]MBL3873040.1 LysR family transcriptional regulator [Pseudomonas syringae pv. theae]GKQ33264.1 LysR family transcriptional regulator [Pseudomonas syringae pv. theae]GKS08646.1 LysR family transcriptional regulator [Pseudomonas syringae pv. theae]
MTKRLAPSITALQCFEAAARHLSFTQAAHELNLTQSAVSKQVAQLEEMLCNQLFARVKGRLALTPAGDLYVSEVDRILIQIDVSSRYILTYGGNTETLSIATQPTFGERWLIPKLAGFGEKHPNIHLDIRSDLEPFDLVKSKTDVAFFFGQGNMPGARCIELFSDEVVPVCSPGIMDSNIFDCQGTLAKHTLLQCVSRPDAWHEWFSQHGIEALNSYHGPRFDTFNMCIRAAQEGYGIALIPRFLVESDIADGKLLIPWNMPIPSAGSHFIAYAEHAQAAPKIKAFVRWILHAQGLKTYKAE